MNKVARYAEKQLNRAYILFKSHELQEVQEEAELGHGGRSFYCCWIH